jgi:MerR family transcriptional regulator, heat shock protein HspR
MSERQPSHAVYVISVFAEIGGVHPQTLRNYERTGLLNPQRTSGGSRRFSDIDLVALRRIQELTNEGINLEGVKRIMVLEAQLEAMKETLRGIASDAQAQVEATHRQYRRELVPIQNTIALFVEAQNHNRENL